MKKLKKSAIYISISWYTKFAHFRWKNADASRTKGVCHVILVLFESSLG